MTFSTDLNTILNIETDKPLSVGQIYPFKKQAKSMLVNKVPIWLIDNNWTALAEITIVDQTLQDNQIVGQYRVDYIYQSAEQSIVSQMLTRMYASMIDPYIYLLSSEKEYDKLLSSGYLIRDSLQHEGFIHASPKSQLNRVANKFYKKTEAPLVLIVDKTKLTQALKWEPATGGLYPHVYGPINSDSIIKSIPIALNQNNVFDINF